MPSNPTIESALSLIGSISMTSRQKLESKLNTAPASNHKDIAGYMLQADGCAPPSSPGKWKEYARAWVMVSLIGQFWGEGAGVLLNPNDLPSTLQKLPTKTEAALREELTDLVTGRGILKRFAAKQRDPKRLAWGSAFTDPKKHNPSSFCYLVSGLRVKTGIEVDEAKQPERAKYLKKQLQGYLGSTEGENWELRSAQLYLENPEVMYTELLSASVIRNDHVKTYGDAAFGFVLSVPAINICSVSPSDLASSTFQSTARADKLAEMTENLAKLLEVDKFVTTVEVAYDENPLSPAELISKTKAGSHNEVLILGSISGSLVRPSALFVKTSDRGVPSNYPRRNMVWKSFVEDDKQFGLSGLIAECSKKLSIPVIDIPDNTGEPSSFDFLNWEATEISGRHIYG